MSGIDEALRVSIVEAVGEALEPLVAVLSKLDREPAPLVYTAAEAGLVLGVSDQTVKRWIGEGHIAKLPHTDRVLIPRASVEAFVAAAAHDPVAGESATREGRTGITTAGNCSTATGHRAAS